MQKQVNFYSFLSQFSLPIFFFLSLVLILCPTLFLFVFCENYDLEVL